MADLELDGPLDLLGRLELAGQGGTVLVNGAEALVEGATGTGVPVILPPPPAPKPIDDGTKARCVSSLGKTVTAGGTPLMTTGMVLQGNTSTWPGMLLPSTGNSGPKKITANALPINVKDDRATVFPNGGSATFSSSGQ